MNSRHARARSLTRRIRFWFSSLMAAGIFILSAAPLRADLVSGRVYDSGGKAVTGKSFTAKNSKGVCVKQFDTDKAGNFGVFLPSGRYSVGYPPPNDDCAKLKELGVIESYSQPVQQDIHLKKQ
jgi:hypothetical protein